MKRLVTGIGLCALLLTPMNAEAATRQWIGATDSDWQTSTNWLGGNIPGANDVVQIRAVDLDPNYYATADWDYTDTNYTYASVQVKCNATYAMTLQKSGTSTLNAGALTLWGYSASKVATLNVDQNMSASSTSVKKDVDIDIESNDTFTAGTVSVGNGSVYADLWFGSASGTGELDATSLTLTAGDAADEDALVDLDYGTLDVNGEVELNASSSVDAEAIIEVASGATFQPDSLDLNGGDSSSRRAILDFDANVTVQNDCDGTVDTSLVGYVDVDVANGTTFTAKDVEIGDGTTAGDVEVKGTGTMTACSLVIRGGSSLTVTGSGTTVQTN